MAAWRSGVLVQQNLRKPGRGPTFCPTERRFLLPTTNSSGGYSEQNQEGKKECFSGNPLKGTVKFEGKTRLAVRL